MIRRKRKILLIQLVIFLFALSLLYNTYRDKNKPTKETIKIETQTDSNTNSFNDIEYSGFDLNGNRYNLKAGGKFQERYFVVPLAECRKRTSGEKTQRLHWLDVSTIDWDPDNVEICKDTPEQNL